MKKARFVELSLSERSNIYKYSFLFASLADLLSSSREYIKDNLNLIDSGLRLLDDILEGQEFILGKRTTFARDNLQLYSYYSKSYQSTRESEYTESENYPDELKRFLEKVKDNLRLIKNNPDDFSLESTNDARLLFETLSDSVNAHL